MSLEGSVALVVGAGKGLGRAIAIGLAEEGADVAAIARTPVDLESLASELVALGRRAFPVPADASNSTEIDSAVASTIKYFGRIDVLVNAVGGNLRKPLTETTDQEWDAALRANLSSTFYACRAVGRHMLSRRRGSVINIASTAGQRGRPNMASYCASKAAVINLSRALAVEWSHAGVRVNAICPGRFLTPATSAEMSDKIKYDAYVQKVPLGRIGQPSELKPIAVWLASEASAFVTGSVVVIDGGQTLT
jgi:NAD(P)-dependent dehydrogenase (short-subunit alcohol dehydrogenase family)